MSAESRMYTFSPESKEHLRKFRLSTSRASTLQAVIYVIDKDTQEIKQDEDQTVYINLDNIAEDLPDNSPRFILLSYPFTKPDGRMAVPYVLISYMPSTCNATSKMMYAAAKELMRNTAEVGQLLEIKSQEELVEEVPGMLGDEK